MWVDRRREDRVLQLTTVVNTLHSLLNLMVTRLLFISITVLTAGCWARPDIPNDAASLVDWPEIDTATEQAAIERLNSLDRSVFDHAWSALEQYSYSQDRSVSVRDQDGETVAHAEQTIEYSGPAGARIGTVTSSDSSGSFETSVWSRFSDSGRSVSDDEVAHEDWAQLVFPSDPLFLSDQGASFFRYAIVGDTLIGDVTVTVLETVVRPETSRQGVQWARVYLDGPNLVGAEMFVAQRSLLYHELSNFGIMLTPISDGVWLPKNVTLESAVGLPFARSRSYEMRVSFRDIRPQ